MEIYLAIIILFFLFFLSIWLNLEQGIYLICLSLPLYLVRFRIGWIPTTFLELMIYFLFMVWWIKKISWRGIRGYCLSVIEKISQLNPLFIPIWLIFIGTTLSVWFSSDLKTSAGLWKAYFLDPLLFLFVFVDVIKKENQIRKTLKYLVYSGILTALISLTAYWPKLSLVRDGFTYTGRLKGFYLSPNHLAMFITPLFLISGWLCLTARFKKEKIFWFLVLLLFLLVLYLTYSYGAWFGLGISLIFGLLMIYQAKIFSFKKSLLILVLLTLLGLGLIYQQSSTIKFKDLLFSSRSSWQSRLIIWRVALEILKDNPFLGIGPGLFQKIYLAYQDRFPPYLEWAVPYPHNLFLAFWLQTSLIGFLGFLWLMGKIFYLTIKKIGLVARKDFSLFLVFLMVFVYILSHGIIDTPYWKNDLSLMFWLIVGCWLVLFRGIVSKGYFNFRL